MRWLLAVPMMLGCRPVEAAPTDLDALFHAFWGDWATAPDETLVENTDLAHQYASAETWTEPVFGTISDLTLDEVAEFNLGLDPATASGMYSVNMLPCAIRDIEPILWAKKQDELYPGMYTSYERTFTTDADAYEAETTDLIRWEATAGGDLVGTPFVEELLGGIHRVREGEASPRGRILVQRTVMNGPAVFDGGSKSFQQDYQIEVYWERAPKETMHLYGIWRELDLGGLTMESTQVQRIILNNFVEWDEKTVANCPAE